MRKLPRHIQSQVDQADAYLAAAAQAAQATEHDAAPPDNPALDVPEPPPVEPRGAEQAPPPTPAPAQDSAEKWEARYKTLQGMHNHNMADMKARMSALEQHNHTMAAQLEAFKQAPAPATSSDPQHAEVFGQDLVDMVTSVAERMFGTAVQKFESRLSTLEQNLNGTTKAVAQTAEEMFLSRLSVAVPDYAEVNADEGFLAWLGEVDDVYGVPRQSALTQAAQALDHDRVAKVFNAYKSTLAPAQRASSKAPTRAASQLERQIAPSTAAPPQTRQVQATTFRAADVQAFYDDVNRGRYKGREAEAREIEAQLNTALAQGRIA